MKREEAIEWIKTDISRLPNTSTQNIHKEALEMAIKALEAWGKFKQALDKRILEQGFDEDEWSVSYNELIKMMKKCGGVDG